MASITSAFMEGYLAGDAIIETQNRSRARKAAIKKYGDIAGDPELFERMQRIEQRGSSEAREQQGFESRERRLDAQEGRQQGTYDANMDDHDFQRNRSALVGLVQGLRQARDTGGDVGEAFDRQRGLLEQLGVDPGDMDDMRNAVVENPALLDEYLTTLTGAGGGAKVARGSAGSTGAGMTADEARAQKSEAEAAKTSAAGSKARGFADQMRGLYHQLDEMGAIRSSDATGVFDRAKRALGSSQIVQDRLSGPLQTRAAGIRAKIKSIIPLMLVQFKDSMGPGVARMFDTEADMRFWKDALTDSTKDYQANLLALDNLIAFLESPEETAARIGFNVDSGSKEMLYAAIDNYASAGADPTRGMTESSAPESQAPDAGVSAADLDIARRIAADPSRASDEDKIIAAEILGIDPSELGVGR